MRALIYDRYGDASYLRVADVDVPRAREGEVVVRVTRAALNPKDVVVRRGKFRAVTGQSFPKLCGLDLAGVVSESRSPRFAVGQRIFGCLGEWKFARGTLAELVACRESEVAALPSEVSEEAGAGMALAGLTALQALRDVGRVSAGQRLLINGASGGVGTAAIQIARILGAEVHSVSSAANQELCKELGANRAWTYPANDWERSAAFDVIFDVFGNLRFPKARRHLTPRGRFISTVPTPGRLVRDWTSRLAKQEERMVIIRPRREDLERMAAWMSEDRLRTVIEGRYPLASFREAFARLESKRARGKIIIELQ